MNFEALYNRIIPRLKKIAHYYNGHGRFIDGDDLCQEMCGWLWSNYSNGAPEGINDAYIIKGCEFHIKNYIRKERVRSTSLSLDGAIDGEGNSLKDILPDTKESPDIIADRHLTIETIMNNSFSSKERDVFALLLEGHTVREIGNRLGISHVMVVKYKKGLLKRWENGNN